MVMGSHRIYILVMKKSIYGKYQQDIQGSVIKLGGSIFIRDRLWVGFPFHPGFAICNRIHKGSRGGDSPHLP